jgi:hypothetical protein
VSKVNSRGGQRQIPSVIVSRGSVKNEDNDSTSADFPMGKIPDKSKEPRRDLSRSFTRDRCQGLDESHRSGNRSS